MRLYRLLAVKLLGACLLVWVSAAHAFDKAQITDQLNRLNTLLVEQPANQTESIAELLKPFVANLNPLAAKTFKKYYIKELNADGRRRVRLDFGQRLAMDLADLIVKRGITGVRLDRFTADDTKIIATLRTTSASNASTLEADWRRQDGTWQLHEVHLDGDQLSKTYYKSFKDILERKYSIQVLLSRLRRLPYIQLENFTDQTIGSVPSGWRAMRTKDEKKPIHFYVREDQGRYYVAAQDTGLSIILGRPLHWNPRQYPILTWCWRANALPPGGNERLDHANDSAAGIYVLFSRNFFGVPRQVKYVWSTTLPEGTIDRRKKIWRPYFFVVESGYANVGKWVFEEVNIYKAHQYAFGNDRPSNRTLAIGLLTDANSTHSYAEAFYADFRAWSLDAQEQGLIKDYCGCFSNSEAGVSPSPRSVGANRIP